MKTITGVCVVIVLICGVLGVNTLKVAVNEVKQGVEQQLPTSFRHAVAEKDVEDRQIQVADAAGQVDLYMLPHYHSAGLQGKVSFAELQKQNLQPFRNMLQDLLAGVEKLDARLCCATGSRVTELGTMKSKLDHLAERAARDLQTLETLQGEFLRLEELQHQLSQLDPAKDSSPKVKLAGSRMESVHRYLADREREAAAAKYRNSMPNDTAMSAAELAELKDVLEALDTDVTTR
jgi:hypothetical protein